MASEEDEFTRHSGRKYRGPERSSPYPVSRLAPPVDLVNVAREIQKADETLSHHVSSKLSVIAEQMRFLQAQAASIMEEAQRDSRLHHAKCQFKKRPGHIYHLYEKDDGSTYFSMLSADDWKGNPPDEYLGAYRLEVDMSWTPAEQIPEQEQDVIAVRQLLGGRE